MRAMRARLLSHFGRQAWVLDAHGETRLCVYKGRDISPTANDDVEIDPNPSPAVISAIFPRRNCVIRSEAHRTKRLAANVDQALIVVSGVPLFSDELLARMICACAAEGITGIVALNKIDRVAETALAEAQLTPFYEALHLLGWQVIRIAARPDQGAANLQAIRSLLEGKTTLIMGQSGMGKSSLLNALHPKANAQTREISEALQTGKHTTTAGLVMALEGPESSPAWLIDTPGFQLFGLHHLSETQLALGFPEWQAIHERDGRCRYANCAHIAEPNCTVRSACTHDKAALRRLELWQMLRASL